MKNALAILIFTINSFCFGQWEMSFSFFDFEDTTNNWLINIPSDSIHSNTWQIGKASKTILNQTISPDNVIITDSIFTYPMNDTSYFEILHLAGYGVIMPHTLLLGGSYFVNSDTLTDFGKIEASIDNRQSWIDLIEDTNVNINSYWYQKPTLSGNSNQWINFEVNLAYFFNQLNVGLYDTIYFRFSFVSDSIETYKDGLMFDNIYFNDYAEGINELSASYIQIFPNPTSDKISFQTKANLTIKSLAFFDILGNECYNKKLDQEKELSLNFLDSGVYFLIFETDQGSVKQLLVKE